MLSMSASAAVSDVHPAAQGYVVRHASSSTDKLTSCSISIPFFPPHTSSKRKAGKSAEHPSKRLCNLSAPRIGRREQQPAATRRKRALDRRDGFHTQDSASAGPHRRTGHHKPLPRPVVSYFQARCPYMRRRADTVNFTALTTKIRRLALASARSKGEGESERAFYFRSC